MTSLRAIAVLCLTAGAVVGVGLTLGAGHLLRDDATAPHNDSIRAHIDALKRFEADAETPDQAAAYRKMRLSAESHATAISRQDTDPSEPRDTVNAIHVGTITGAPSDGDKALRSALQAKLKDAGVAIEAEPQDCGLSVSGEVNLTPQGDKDDIAIIWTVRAHTGSSPGKVSQRNKVPAGAFDDGWGEDAGFVAQGAVDGLLRVIEQARISCG